MDFNSEMNKFLSEIGDDRKPLANEIVGKLSFLKARLDELEKMPFIQCHPDNPERQRVTPAGKQYKELSQSYNAYIKTLLSMTKKQDKGEQISPLREYFKGLETR